VKNNILIIEQPLKHITTMKRITMMICIAVAVLLLSTESIQAQSRVVRRARTERRDERQARREEPRRPQREPVIAPAPRPVPVKVVDNEVIRAFEHERFDSDRLKMADMIFSTGGLMTVAQITRISENFAFDDSRVKFLKKAYINCIDCHNFYRVLPTLQFSSSRDKIMKFVIEDEEHRHRDGEPYGKVSSSDMNAIVKALKNETFDSSREKLADMIVAGNLLTSRQIADMAKTFQFDSNRYDFLLYAYRNCVDPQNYVIAANTLQFSTNRSDLMKKISRRP
jgi:hypothetical protein